MATEGEPLGRMVQDEREHFVRCPVCGELLDMRDLAEVLDHLHGQIIAEEPTVR